MAIHFFAYVAQANVLGNMHTFAPSPDSLVFQNIHSSQTIEKNYFNIGFFTAYVRNELSVYSNLVQPGFVDYKDKALTFDLIFAWGITESTEFTYSLPGYFSQEPESGQSRQNFISEGINGHRLGIKYDISQEKTGGFAVATSADLTTTEDNPYIGNSPSPIWNIEFIYDAKYRDSAYGFNLGYRKRTPGDPATNAYFLTISDQLIASAGYVMGLAREWRFHAELFSSYGLSKENHPDQNYISSLEILLGGKHRLARNLWGHFGATAEILPKGLAPDYRIYLGINHFFGFGAKEGAATSSEKNTTLSVQPYEIVLNQNERQKITVVGGTAPYSYKLTYGLGFFNESTLEYEANDQLGEDELVVKDSEGAVVSVPVRIQKRTPLQKMPDPLEINPSEISVYAGAAVQIQVHGGTLPYTADLNPLQFGNFSSQTLKYRAPLKTGDVEIIIKDKQGQTAKALVHVIPIPKPAKAVVLRKLHFIFNTSELTKSSRKELDRNLSNMSHVRIKKLIVVGHTDSIGSAEYNQDLSQSRAETVAQIIRTKFNLNEKQVEAVGYGESQPIASNKTEKGRLTNRRVELKLYYNQ